MLPRCNAALFGAKPLFLVLVSVGRAAMLTNPIALRNTIFVNDFRNTIFVITIIVGIVTICRKSDFAL